MMQVLMPNQCIMHQPIKGLPHISSSQHHSMAWIHHSMPSIRLVNVLMMSQESTSNLCPSIVMLISPTLLVKHLPCN